MLGHRCCTQAFSLDVESGATLSLSVQELSIVVAFVVKHGSAVVGHGLVALRLGDFRAQGFSPCPLHWQEDLNHWTSREVHCYLIVVYPISLMTKDVEHLFIYY